MPMIEPLKVCRCYASGLISHDELMVTLGSVNYASDGKHWHEVVSAHDYGYLTDDDYNQLVRKAFA